ncbi:condensin complex subunit 2-like [Zingiber officinale]|uniref:condensin complex subunit 2-like n=1 Tax=Zingiber officinale TaxID=94328 RepID=UPI001C4BE31D|nr:condensin complex subunit 2-like [Zingiber officinale]
MGDCSPSVTAPHPLPSKTPMASRLQSPPFHLGSNNDELERAQARAAARAASVRRKSVVPSQPLFSESRNDIMDRSQIMDLFHNCIKLASENKINQKNTWELSLIDHLSEIIRVSPEDDEETNFQKASCTLEAGVKIYSMRVDSVHSEAYKVLGGINRAGREEDNDTTEMGDNIDVAQTDDVSKKELERKLSPLSTLESSFEALNIKKFDEAFIVDPLYHQTSAQFDEGGAKGLLLNNLGVYGGCRVLFDSFECPERSMSTVETEGPELIDLSFAKDYIEKMMICMLTANDISPTLKDILNQFDEENRRPDINDSPQEPITEDFPEGNDQIDVGENGFDDDCGAWNLDHDDRLSVADDNSTNINLNYANDLEEDFECNFNGPNVEEKFEKITDFLSVGLGFTSKSNAWAGPDHWKYRKAKGLDQKQSLDTNTESVSKKSKNRKDVNDIDFTKSLEIDMSNIFAPPKNPKSLLLPANKATCITSLPEDCHYQPESLVKLFLLPNVMCLGKKGRQLSDEPRQNDGSYVASWENDSTCDNFDDGLAFGDTDDQGSLVRQPRQVSKIDIQYDKVSKQVDVHALKNMLWNHMQKSVQVSYESQDSEATVYLTQILLHLPIDCSLDSAKDISPHLTFICLLHLANEHCLRIHDCPTMDELEIVIPSSALK